MARRCWHFRRPGGCWFGSDCAFLHEEEKKSSSELRICRYFKTPVGCRYGRKCRFIHPGEPNREPEKKICKAEEENDLQTSTTDHCVNKEKLPEPLVSKDEHSDSEEGARSAENVNTGQKPENKYANWKLKESYSCGECSEVFKGPDVYEKLIIHYFDMLDRMDNGHLGFLTSNPWFNKLVICSACQKDFVRSRNLLRHLIDKCKLVGPRRNHESHLSMLETVNRAFVDRDVGLITQNEFQETLVATLTLQKALDKDSEGCDGELGLKLYFLSDSLRLCQMSEEELDTDIEEKSSNFGFTEEQVNDLLSQGVKPWDEDAHLVLAVLQGYYDYMLL